jgi:hypothetical protein
MGNVGFTELLLMAPGCLIGLFGLCGWILGTISFFKVRKLEKQFNELRQNQFKVPPA